MPERGNTLIFFTDSFPYGTDEAFIENEFPFLTSVFSKVIIITNNLNEQACRPIPTGVMVIRFPYGAASLNKIQAVFSLPKAIIRNEMGFVTKHLKLSLNRSILSILLGTYAKAVETSAFIEDLVSKHGIETKKLFLYSYWMNDMAAGIALYKSKHPEAKGICRAHRWDIYLEKQPTKYLPFRTFIVQHLNACYSISQHGAVYLKTLTQNKFNPRIKYAPLGTLNNRNTLAAAGKNKLVLVSCSSIIERKRLDLIVNALAMIDDYDVEWIHLGNGPIREIIEKSAIEKLSNKSNISFGFKGQLSNQQIIDYYSNRIVDLFINVSESEGVPVSIMEAFSFGIPAVATNTGGVAEIIETDSNGFLLDVNCTAATIAKTIEDYILRGEQLQKQFRAKAFETWNTRYNAERNYTAFVAGILSL